jgi:hypothetical protein
MELKPGSAAAFAELMENEVIPLLRKQDGFQDEIAFIRPGGTMAVGISLWENKRQADDFQREFYPGVVLALSKIIEGTPRVRSFEVTNSTWHKVAAG